MIKQIEVICQGDKVLDGLWELTRSLKEHKATIAKETLTCDFVWDKEM